MTELTISLYISSKPKFYQIFTSMTRKPQKEARRNNYLFMTLFIHPSICLVRICLFLLAYLFFFWKGRRGGKGSISYLSYACKTCPSSPTQSHSPPPLPSSLSLWDDAGINHLFHQSIFVNRLKSVLFDVGINTMVLLFIV